MKRLLQFILLFITSILTVYAQPEKGKVYPEVGKPCPDFILRNIKYYSKKHASLSDFKGKWLILDFWNVNCASCVASFPRTNEMQKEFQNKVLFMLVGYQDKGNQIQKLYSRFRAKEGLVMPCAFDSTLCNRFDIYTAPHIIILDNNSIVRSITHSVNSGDIKNFLAGKNPELEKSYRFMGDTTQIYKKILYDTNKPFLINGNGADETDFLFRSVLTVFSPSKHEQSIPLGLDDSVIKKGRFEVLGAPLFWLYNYAYFGAQSPMGEISDSTYGKYYDYPILELHDSTAFQYSYKRSGGKNVFSYSLIMPPDRTTKAALEKAMQRDLLTYFGFDAKIEIRKCPCWRLTASQEAKTRLKTKGEPYTWQGSRAGFTAKNFRMKNLLQMIQSNNHDKIHVIIDDTGIENNIDITVDCILTDLTELKSALHANGLDLIKEEKDMKVLVIREPSSKLK